MVSASLTVDTVVITYPRKLLALARKLIDGGEFATAVVVAHIACEVATERALSDGFVAKGVLYSEDSITELFSGYNLANDKIRKLYTALTGDHVAQEPFWASFMASATRRNKVTHSGETIVTEAEANESHQVATALVDHLKK